MGFFKKLFGRKDVTVYLSEEEMTGISDHYGRHVGETGMVFHEVVSDRVHIDVYTIPEVPGRDFKVLYTTGMSAIPMPDVGPEECFAELFVVLPKSWPISESQIVEDENFWPIQFMKSLARLPTDYGKAISPGISMPYTEPPQNLPGSQFSAVMIGRPTLFPGEFSPARIAGKTINFYPVVPMTQAEVDWKVEQIERTALLDRYERAGIDPLKVALIDRTRPDLV